MIMTKDQSKIIVVNGSVTLCYGAGVLVGMMFGNEASELMSHVIDFSILLIIANVLFLREEWKRVFK